MNLQDHLLTILSEECSEVIKEVSKSLRFGLKDFHPKYDNIPNDQRISNELCDLIAMVEMLQDEGVIPELSRDKIEYKKEKVKKYMEYSKKMGKLT